MKQFKYQLVLQFSVTELIDYDNLRRFEERLLTCVQTLAHVDGHDFGCDQFNIFLLTDHPVRTSQMSEELRRSELPNNVPAVAYRELLNDKFIVLSPPFLKVK